MAQSLGNVAVGTTLKLNENGTLVDFYVAKHDYESSLNGAGRTLVVRKDTYDDRVWDNGNVNAYASSDLDSWFNSTYKNMLDADIRSLIGTTKIRYTPGNGNNTVGTLERAIFALSLTELGQSHTYANTEGSALPIASTLRIAYHNGSATTQWTRSPYTGGTHVAWGLDSGGVVDSNFCNRSYGSRPAFTLPSGLIVDDSNIITANQVVPPSNITVPSIAMQQRTLPVSWTSVSVPGADVTYQLQRNADNGGWTTIYTGADTSYTDTAGTWTQVQYQVAAVIESVVGSYTQSAVIPVSDPAVLVISGSDGNLGTLTSNLPYTVSSNTGNPISLTRTVNGAQVVTLTVESGFAYNIPIADLPTGTGTIQITASVENGSETVTQTRTWTYYKTPINIPSTGGIAQLTQNGQNIWPVTVPDAVEAPVYLGGNLNAAFNYFSKSLENNSKYLDQAVYYKTVTPSAQLGTLPEGSIIYLNENGSSVPFYVAKQGYEPSYNTDRVLVVRKEAVQSGQWNSTNVNTYDGSTIDTWFSQTYLQTLDSDVQTAISTTNIPYTASSGSGVSRISKAIFALSLTELIVSSNFANVEGTLLPIASTLASVSLNETPSVQWTRSPYVYSGNSVCQVSANGSAVEVKNANTSAVYRPAFTLPSSFMAYISEPVYSLYDISDNFLLKLPGVQIETGSYVGTGTYGASNPNSLTFEFEPKILIVQKDSTNYAAYSKIVAQNGMKTANNGESAGNDDYYVTFINWTHEVSWYSSSKNGQLNSLGTTYYYLALG